MTQSTKQSGKRPPDLAETLARLRRTDRAVLLFLDRLRGEGDTCTAGHNAVARGAEVSPRQVQMSTARLIEEGLLERIGYDFGNLDRSRRGSIYRVLFAPGQLSNHEEAQDITRVIQDILEQQKSLASGVEQLSLAHDKLISLISQAMTLPGLRNLK